MKTSSCPNLNRETTSFPNFFTFFQDPDHHQDTTLNKRPKIDPGDGTEDSENSPLKDILSPLVSFNEIGFSAVRSSVGMFRSESEQEDRILTNTSSVFPSTYSSSVESNKFSVNSGGRSEGPNPTRFSSLDQWSHHDYPCNEFRRPIKMSKSTFNFIQGRNQDTASSKFSFVFTEVDSVQASRSKVVCCHFSSDGKLLVSGAHDKKAVLWSTDTLKAKCTLEGHTSMITDVRFSPNMPRLATSSFDKTVRVWEADNPDYPLRTFAGQSRAVISLDFHPNKDDLICSCDEDGKIRYWSINNGCCRSVFKGGTTQTRFQPRLGRYLAAAAEKVVSIFDVETQALRHSLRGHKTPVHAVCWDPSGELLASLSDDSVRVWALGSGSEGKSVHELSCIGLAHRVHSCVFHPSYASVLVIGCYQSLELWNMSENKTMTLTAHGGLIAGLAASPMTGLVASASHDKFVKLWK